MDLIYLALFNCTLWPATVSYLNVHIQFDGVACLITVKCELLAFVKCFFYLYGKNEMFLYVKV